MDDPNGLWYRLPAEIQERVDAQLEERRVVTAIAPLRDHAELEPKPDLSEAQETAARRLQWLIEHGRVQPEPAITMTGLLDKARSLREPVVAIEAVWDGDTHGWFVELLAIVERPGPHNPRFDEVSLTLIRHGGDTRLFNGTVPPWPEAAAATEQGQALARALGVPFTSPVRTPQTTRRHGGGTCTDSEATPATTTGRGPTRSKPRRRSSVVDSVAATDARNHAAADAW